MEAKERICLLFDNGSVRAASTRHLRDLAAKAGARLGLPVQPTSLLHSDKVDPRDLGGEPAVLLEQAVRAFWEAQPEGEALLVPAFFGPSRALTHYVPERMAAIGNMHPKARWKLAPCLVDLQNNDSGANLIGDALAAEARRIIAGKQLRTAETKVLLVDHGSPQPGVTAVREHLGARIREILGQSAARIGTASMERRPGEKYAFNEPLLAKALRTPPFDHGDVVVLLQFLSPGRHAGPQGDIATICNEAKTQRPELRTWLSDAIGNSPQVVEVLAKRFGDLLKK